MRVKIMKKTYERPMMISEEFRANEYVATCASTGAPKYECIYEEDSVFVRCVEEIVEHFGPGVVGKDGELHRKALADIVFHNEEELKCLNAIVHPAVETYIREWIQKERENGTKIFFLENALLLELKHDELFCDEIWYIYANDETRMKRLKLARGYSEQKTEAIFRAQRSKEEFMEKCDRVIDNSRSFEETCVQLLHVLDKL